MKLPNRIYIIGTSASGKSTLANKLSKKFKIPHYNLDDIFWYKKYSKRRNKDKVNEKILEIIKKKKWIMEGVSGVWTEKGIKKSDLVIWLDFPFRVLSSRLIKRHILKKKKDEDENLKNLVRLIKYVKNYKTSDHGGSYKIHKEVIEKHKVNLLIIKNNKQLKNFLKD